ncbi:MAG: hypothetical protein WD025_02665 [Bacteriovoracaceae bacterium]
MDHILKELVDFDIFTKDEFVGVFKKHKPLNLFDPIWNFIIEEELGKYRASGAVRQINFHQFQITPKARQALGQQEAQERWERASS